MNIRYFYSQTTFGTWWRHDCTGKTAASALDVFGKYAKGPSLTRALLKERAEERVREDRIISERIK